MMQCVTPMFYQYRTGDKKNGHIISRAEAREALENDNNIFKKYRNMNKKIDSQLNIIPVPCKKCWACRLNYSAEWATRIMNEANGDPNCYFITLTYNDQEVPIAEKMEWDEYPNGEKTHKVIYNDGTWKYTLDPEDPKRFIKSLRKYFERKGHTGIKYFYCGEYGETTERPHYHFILMHCPLDPLQFYSPIVDKRFKAHWKSHELERFWKDKGFVEVAELEWSCAAYVARYCTKKLVDQFGKEPMLESGRFYEFVRMSNNIGIEYYKSHKLDIYKNDEMIMRTVKGNIGSFKPPKAYDRLMKKENPELFRAIEISRKHEIERRKEIEDQLSNYTDLKKLEMKADRIKIKANLLPRTEN